MVTPPPYFLFILSDTDCLGANLGISEHPVGGKKEELRGEGGECLLRSVRELEGRKTSEERDVNVIYKIFL